MTTLEKIKNLSFFNQVSKEKEILTELVEAITKAPNYATTALAIADITLLAGALYTVGATKQVYLK